MNNYNLKKEADKLMEMKGNVRGEAFRTHATYIRHREGERGVKAVEKKMTELGYPLKFDEIKPLRWYSESHSVLVILVAKELFNWKDSDIFDMGNSAPKYSFIVKLLMKYFLSPKTTLEQSPKYWRKHYDFGKLEVCQFDEKEKYMSVRVKGYKTHPIVCIFHKGYFLRLCQYVIKSKNITIEETKCMFKGDPYHEHVVRWE